MPSIIVVGVLGGRGTVNEVARNIGVSNDVPAGTLYELLAVQARCNPQAIAILSPGRDPLSFGALLDQIDEVRTTLNASGMGRGDRIGLLAPRGPETAVCALAIASCAVCVPLNPEATVAELEEGLRQTRAKAILVPATASDNLRDLLRRLEVMSLEYSVASGAPAGKIQLRGERVASVAHGGAAMPADIAFVLRSSGTTAAPKIVPCSHANIVARASKFRRLLGLNPADRSLNLMPLCYSHGLNSGLIGPLVSGGSAICPPVFDRATFLTCVRELLPTWYTAGFTYHQAIFEWLSQRPDALAGHRLRFVRVGSGPLSQQARLGLERILGAPVLEVYSSSETGSITANPIAGIRKPGTVGISPDDDVAVMDLAGNLVSAGVKGEIVVRGPTVFDGYEANPAANQRAFCNGWYRTGDEGIMDADGYLKVSGRLDEVINRGGEKISPREVDEALLEHHAVAEAASFPLPHPTLHQELVAAVVPHRGAQVSEDELRQFLAARLTPFKIPRRIIWASELPKTPRGKLARNRLADHFGLTVNKPSSATAETQTTIQEVLLGCWREVLRRDDIGCDDDFFLLGGDSITAMDLILRIEENLQYRVPLTLLAEAPTIRKLETRLERATLGAIGNTIRVHATGTRRPLFALSGRYGHALRLLPILHALGPDQPGYALQPPGMDWAGVGCVTIQQMAAHYIGAVKAVQSQGPYSLFGESFGGLVAFEMALQLQAAGESVEFLGMADTAPPTCIFDGSADVSISPSFALPKAANWVEKTNNAVADAHVHARSLYHLDAGSEQTRFRGELTYFYCTGRPVTADDRRRLWGYFADRFNLLPVPGVHGTVHQEPMFSALTRLLRECLDGESPAFCDAASVFGRSFRLQRSGAREDIISSTGDIFRIQEDGLLGGLDAVHDDGSLVRIEGWAVETSLGKPPPSIVVFLDDGFLGYGGCGVDRPDVATWLAAPSARYSGFDFWFSRDAIFRAIQSPRLFALSTDGRATELRLANRPHEVLQLMGRRLASLEATIEERSSRLLAVERTLDEMNRRVVSLQVTLAERDERLRTLETKAW